MAASISTSTRLAAHEHKYPCVECTEHFSSPDRRSAHLRTAHGREGGFLCHECAWTHSHQLAYNVHMRDHNESRPPTGNLRKCTFCDFQSVCAEALDRHRRDDHNPDGSLRAQCPECEYTNDSIVGISVHRFYVHSEAGRSAEAQRQHQAEARASVEAGRERAALARGKRRRDSSSDETVEGSDEAADTTAQPAKKPRLDADQQRIADSKAPASESLLAKQMEILANLSPEEKNQFGLNHKQRKKYNQKAKRAGKS